MKFIKTLTATAILLGAMAQANASAIITDGNVKLGVDDYGNLNIGGDIGSVTGTTAVGLRYLTANGEYEATSHGCLCEGWGVAIADNNTSGYANNAAGTAGLSVDSFSSTASTASSTTLMGSALKITHSFALAAETANLFRVKVTIENTSGADINNLLYRRTFDWDTDPSPFNEYVTIGGTAAATAVLAASNDGFCSSNPLSGCPGSVSGDFVAAGPTDHGANFDFDFGALVAGGTYSFDIFYGAASNKTAALNALGEVGAEVYSLGWSGLDANQDGTSDNGSDATPTFIFGFSGVGGVALPDPTDVPAPAPVLLLGLGLFGLAMSRRQRKAA
ncbi:hypothetical protein A5320_17440 [Rheinheimera sp. SA_1]|jgi:type IV pilus assembly protein PilY1|uniref:PEP-CTERM sorting domain-containing protein n=1 Tax=Rheinheimera sp. SA_1 TaxID=1827365 RepID=UPI0008015C1A|nr:PEP-CTERM sorting domain-containing protein [Rheinheimera sp. SA_1]OBP13704.1 hypothetical protein A5320_17440 [Rheinheimera sp. SA_1]